MLCNAHKATTLLWKIEPMVGVHRLLSELSQVPRWTRMFFSTMLKVDCEIICQYTVIHFWEALFEQLMLFYSVKCP